MIACLWEFPASDHQAWQAFTGFDLTPAEYRDQLTAIQADLERQGHEVVRVRFTVAEMQRRLSLEGLENTPPNRGTILAQSLNL